MKNIDLQLVNLFEPLFNYTNLKKGKFVFTDQLLYRGYINVEFKSSNTLGKGWKEGFSPTSYIGPPFNDTF